MNAVLQVGRDIGIGVLSADPSKNLREPTSVTDLLCGTCAKRSRTPKPLGFGMRRAMTEGQCGAINP